MIELAELTVRALATGLVVVGVTLLAQYHGTRVGGIVAGLPLVVGPGMFFVLLQEGPQFTSEAAVGIPFALAGSVAFAWSFARLAVRRSAWASLAAAVAVWIAVLAILRLLPETLGIGLAAFGVAVLVSQLLGHDPAAEHAAPAVSRGRGDLVLRGAAAGLLVGTVSLAAPLVGPGLSGVLLAFPITLVVLGVALHQRQGGATAARTLAATQLSMTSIAVFAATLSISLGHLPPQTAFWLAVAASITLSVALSLSPFLRPPAMGGSADGR